MDTKQSYDRLKHPFDTRGSTFDMRAPTYGMPFPDSRSGPPGRGDGLIPSSNFFANSGADPRMRGPFDQRLGSQHINRCSPFDVKRGHDINQRDYTYGSDPRRTADNFCSDSESDPRILAFNPQQWRGHGMYGPSVHHFNSRNPPFDMRGPSNAFCGLNSGSRFTDPSEHHLREPDFCGTDPRMSGRGMRHRFHDMFGEQHRRHRSSSKSSSSDSDNKCKKKCEKKSQHFKKWQQMSYLMSDPNWNKVECTLCWRQIRPLVETEVLECGHIYHRLCLKELFAVSQREDQSGVFCTQCRHQIDTDLVTEFKNRFYDEPITDPQNFSKEEMTKDMQDLKVK